MSETPLSDVLLKNCKEKRKASWARRFARALQTEEIPENTEFDEAVAILEAILKSICTSSFEKESLLTLLENDGSKEAMAILLPRVVARFEAKASHGIGVMAKGPNRRKYGPLSVALSNDSAVSHKAECEPETMFRISTEELDHMWLYLKPKPFSKGAKRDCKWELRLIERHWHEDAEDKYHFVLVRLFNNPRTDDVVSESYHGSYEWLPLMYNGDTYDKYKLELELPTFGNTDKVTGSSSDLTITYRRDIDHREHLHYVEHSWGRVGTSECIAFDQLFPPYFVEGESDEMSEEAIGKLIDASLRKLGNGAQAGMDVHEEYVPQERKKEYADGF